MAKPPSPLVGFNNNVKHLGRIFHVQTEDSGVSRPHVVTHLFADGGRIIKSTRTDYAEHLDRPDMSVIVRRLMKEQHKAMFIALRDGQLNETIEASLGPVPGEAPPAAVAAADPEPEAPPPAATPRKLPLPKDAALAARVAPTISVAAEVAVTSHRPASTLADLVLSDLGAARANTPSAEGASPEGKPAPRGATPTLGTPATSQRFTMARSPSGRYAAARPSPIFSAPPGENSLFGGSSISEQSLDEVILSYLAEDLDPPSRD